MIKIRKSADRGHARHGWLDSHHTFSFANYHDPAHMGFRDLRVINEDRVEPGQGFGKHHHKDMEILSYVIDGALEHGDNMGNGSVVRPGEIQRMSAGKGVIHSEFNASESEPVHFLQVWILPERAGIEPGYEQKHFDEESRTDALRLVASRDGRDGSTTIHQDVDVYATLLDPSKQVSHDLGQGRHAWVQMVRGSLDLNGTSIDEGDGAGISDEAAVAFVARSQCEFLLFDLA